MNKEEANEPGITQRFNADGYDREGYNREGYNRLGYDNEGYDRDGKNPENLITISDEDKKRIKKFGKRFATIQDFVTRAISVNLAWEENPFTSMDTFAQKSPTIKQYVFLKEFMDSELLNKMFPNYPAEFGEEWEKYEKENNQIENKKDSENRAKNQREERRDRKNFAKLKLELSSSQSYVKAEWKNIANDENEIKYDGWPLLFGHYSRIFPAQIALHVLGNLMRKLDSTAINFETFTKEAYDVAEEIATEYLAKERKDNTLKRVKKISIGLPKPYEGDEITAEQSIKEQRYKDRNFGKIKKIKEGNKSFEGLMSALGLIRVFEKKDEVSVTFSEKGKTMYLMKNPIFQETDDAAFSPQEQDFVIEDLISERKLEAKLIEVAKKTIKDSKNEANTVKDIEQAFQNEMVKFAKTCSDSNTVTRLEKMIKMTEDTNKENSENKDEDRKQTAIEAVRIATLGRMAELGVIDWETNSEKKSLYTIAKKN